MTGSCTRIEQGQKVRCSHKDLFAADSAAAAHPGPALHLRDLLSMFATFKLGLYDSVDNAVAALAFRAKALKIALVELGPAKSGAHLNQLRADFGALLYRNGQQFTWEKFVDSYVQIAAFGALLMASRVRAKY